MQVFVEIMLGCSSGEEQTNTELLTNLMTVTTAYAALIYDPISKDASNKVLADRCHRIWVALDETPQLPHLLVGHYYNYNHYNQVWPSAMLSSLCTEPRHTLWVSVFVFVYIRAIGHGQVL